MNLHLLTTEELKLNIAFYETLTFSEGSKYFLLLQDWKFELEEREALAA